MIESEMNRGVWLDRSEAENTTLRELLNRYEKEVVPKKRGAVQESSVLAAWRETALSIRMVATVRGTDVAALRDDWLKVLAPATVLRRLAVLSHVFNTARREWGMESMANPVELVGMPTPDNARTRRVVVYPSAQRTRGRTHANDELARVIATTESPWLPIIVTLAVETAKGENLAARLPKAKLAFNVRSHMTKLLDNFEFSTPNAAFRHLKECATPHCSQPTSVFQTV
jgi:hypothetical protein